MSRSGAGLRTVKIESNPGVFAMFRPIVLALSCCAASAPLVVGATDSQVDTSFATTAAQPGWQRAFVQSGGFVDESIVAAARAPDGGYVLAGSRQGGGAGALIFLAKFRPDGSYDANFGGTAATGNAGAGRVLKDAYLSSVADMTIDAQGRIVVVGKTPGAQGQSDFGVVRFKPDGSDDTSFAGDGGTSMPFDYDAENGRVNDEPNSVTIAPDGSIFVAGTVQDRTNGGNATTRVGVLKLKTDGSPDTSFGYGDGTVRYCGGQCENVLEVARIVYDAPRDRFVLGGHYSVSENDSDWFVIVWTANDDTVSVRPYAINLGGASLYQLAHMTDLAVQADGKLVALGWANDEDQNSVPVLLRVQTDSLEDTSFGNRSGRGLMVLPWTGAIAHGLTLDSRGRLLLAGEYPYLTIMAGIAARLLPSGAIDTSFNGTSSPSAYYAPSHASSAYRTVFKRVFLDAGRPVLAGEAPDSTTSDFDYDLVVTRLNYDLIFANGFE